MAKGMQGAPSFQNIAIYSKIESASTESLLAEEIRCRKIDSPQLLVVKEFSETTEEEQEAGNKHSLKKPNKKS